MAGDVRLTGPDLARATYLLETVAAILDTEGVRYWLEGGTLLGIVRERRLLPWDNDVDLSMMSEELPALLRAKKAIRRAGLRVRVRRQQVDNGPLKRGQVRLVQVAVPRGWFGRYPVTLDIFVKYRVENTVCWSVGRSRNVLKATPWSLVKEQTRIEFSGRTYPAPANPAAYLEHRYGNWRQTVRNWDFRADDLAIRGEVAR